MNTIKKLPGVYQKIWIIATVLCGIYAILVLVSLIGSLIESNFHACDHWTEIFDDAGCLLFLTGFVLVLLKRPGLGGIIIVLVSIGYVIGSSFGWEDYPLGSVLMIPALIGGLLYLLFWWKIRRR